MERSVNKQVLRRVLTSLLAALLTLALVEVALRAFWQPATSYYYYKSDPILNHRLRPRIRTWRVLHDGRRIEIITNAKGLRDVEYGPKEANELRLLVLGDSFIEATTNPFPLISSKRLERMLNERYQGQNLTVHVINGGQVSYSPILEFIFLKTELIDLAPDIVLLNLDMGDVQDDLFYSLIADYDENGEPMRVAHDRPVPMIVQRKWEPPAWQKWLIDQLRLAHFIDQRFHLHAMREAVNVVPGDLRYDRLATTRDEANGLDEHYQRTGSYLTMIDRYLKERGIPLLIFAYPLGHQVAPDEWPQGRLREQFEAGQVYTGTFFPFLQRYCAAQQLNCRLLLDAFRAYRGDEPLYLPYDGHWTPAGEAFMAQQQFTTLVESGWLPPIE